MRPKRSYPSARSESRVEPPISLGCSMLRSLFRSLFWRFFPLTVMNGGGVECAELGSSGTGGYQRRCCAFGGCRAGGPGRMIGGGENQKGTEPTLTANWDELLVVQHQAGRRAYHNLVPARCMHLPGSIAKPLHCSGCLQQGQITGDCLQEPNMRAYGRPPTPQPSVGGRRTPHKTRTRTKPLQFPCLKSPTLFSAPRRPLAVPQESQARRSCPLSFPMMPRPGVRGKPLSRIQLPRSLSSGAVNVGAASSGLCKGHSRVHTRNIPLADQLQGSGPGTRLDPRPLGNDNTPTGRQGAFHSTLNTSPKTLAFPTQASTTNSRPGLTLHASPNGLRQSARVELKNFDGRPQNNGDNVLGGVAGWKGKRRMFGGWGPWRTYVDPSRLPSLRPSSSVSTPYSIQEPPFYPGPIRSTPAFLQHGEMPGQSSIPLANMGGAHFDAPFVASDHWLKFLFPLNYGIQPVFPPQWLYNMNLPGMTPNYDNPGIIHGPHSFLFLPQASNAYHCAGVPQPPWRDAPARPFGPTVNAAVRAGYAGGNAHAAGPRVPAVTPSLPLHHETII